jgi:DNA-binding transcriptional MerR regulator
MAPKTYTTTQAARAIGVTRATIQAWVAKRIVEAPQIQTRPGKSPVRLWTASDVARLKAAKKRMKKRIGRPKKEG